jgi:hypothetical protein
MKKLHEGHFGIDFGDLGDILGENGLMGKVG